MNSLYNYVFGDNIANYVEVGFSEQQAKAMSWIASQKPKGKCLGLVAGSFLAYSWGHWHERISSYFKLSWSKRATQFLIISASISFGNYVFVARRHGAQQVLPSILMFNNNLFIANLDSLVRNFNILNRKFTTQQINIFNDRAVGIRSNIDLKDRKWIYNPALYTKQEFDRRIKMATHAPWEDKHLANTIKYENIERKTNQLVLAPSNLNQLIDRKGDRLGIVNELTPYWTPLK